eukprot:CAMPEP_0185807730 /NCGR_PEP_ID=MMETSP1322-20130828/5187_1 /TAXON_ID=265543 /ORGANISM="Minutocellus polymorphus, Strain RCC2270" /LENGTH=133 /DNA_ID=CAMNT_0028503899 /DNA_START=31 /DNA_END=432 /DNA_ORIENTATION=+
MSTVSVTLSAKLLGQHDPANTPAGSDFEVGDTAHIRHTPFPGNAVHPPDANAISAFDVASGDRIGGLSRPVAAYLLPDILAQTGTVECEAVDEVEWNCYPFYQEIEIVLEVTPARKAQIVANFAHLRGAIDAW